MPLPTGEGARDDEPETAEEPALFPEPEPALPERPAGPVYELVEFRYRKVNLGAEQVVEKLLGCYADAYEAIKAGEKVREAFMLNPPNQDTWWIVRQPGRIQGVWIADSRSKEARKIDLRDIDLHSPGRHRR